MFFWQLTKPAMRYFRARRYRDFKDLFPPTEYPTVLDLGGSALIWEMMDYGTGTITLLNLSNGRMLLPKNSPRTYKSVVGDARSTQYPDKTFDLVFSNSVIEHVGSSRDAASFAQEMRRLGRSYFCQTPNKWFPIEPHHGTLFIHWWPRLLRVYPVFRWLTLRGLMNKPDHATALDAANEVRLLTRTELQSLFPEATILTERFLGFPKSYMAVYRS